MYTYNEIMKLLNDLFMQAHKEDEFEFCCSLLRIRGVESPGWDSLYESQSFINKTMELMEEDIDKEYKLRLFILLYCHITEMDDFYNIIANMLRVTDGERYSLRPFSKVNFEDSKDAKYPTGKVKRIIELAEKVKLEKIGEYFEYILENNIRNAFFHSDYTIYNGYFRIVNGKGALVENLVTKDIKLNWLIPKIELAINMIRGVLHLVISSRENYKEEETVRGRMLVNDQYTDVILEVNERGLIGFRC